MTLQINDYEKWPRIGAFKTVDYVVGKSLERISVIEKNSNGSFFGYGRLPSEMQLNLGCDTCKVHHSNTNTLCAYTWKITSPAATPGMLYKVTGNGLVAQPAYKRVDIEEKGGLKVTKQVWINDN